MQSTPEIISKNLLHLRKVNSLSQEDLAVLAQVSPRTIARLESAEHKRLDQHTLAKVAAAFNIKTSDLTGAQEFKPVHSSDEAIKRLANDLSIAACNYRTHATRVKRLRSKLQAEEKAMERAALAMIEASTEISKLTKD